MNEKNNLLNDEALEAVAGGLWPKPPVDACDVCGCEYIRSDRFVAPNGESYSLDTCCNCGHVVWASTVAERLKRESIIDYN